MGVRQPMLLAWLRVSSTGAKTRWFTPVPRCLCVLLKTVGSISGNAIAESQNGQVACGAYLRISQMLHSFCQIDAEHVARKEYSLRPQPMSRRERERETLVNRQEETYLYYTQNITQKDTHSELSGHGSFQTTQNGQLGETALYVATQGKLSSSHEFDKHALIMLIS